MKFLTIAYIEKTEIIEEACKKQQLKRVHQAPIEHHIVHWIECNSNSFREVDGVKYFMFTKEDVKRMYDICNLAHAEKVKATPRPWKHMLIPDEANYRFPIAGYEKEYGTFYYDSVYKYINVLGVILNIFDFETKQLLLYVND